MTISYPTVMLTLAATGLLLLAHILRAGRWGLLFPPTYLSRRFNLLLSLGVGYAINLIVPLRVGELVRVLLVSRRDRIRFSHVAATVFIERVTDLLAVSLILAVMFAVEGDAAPLDWITPALMFALGVAALAGTTMVRRSLRLRQLIWRGASVFNERIRVEIADFSWAATEILAAGTLLRWRFLSSTVAMWALYLAAYDVLSLATGLQPIRVLDALLNQPQNALLQNLPRHEAVSVSATLVLFATLPILAIILYGVVRHQQRFAMAWDTFRNRGKSGIGSPAAARRRFEAVNTYDYFLASLFSGANQLVTGFGMEGADDCIIHKFFRGGSDAITALVEVDERLLIRKFAVGAAGQKLKTQADWLRQRGNGPLPLVAVLGEQVLGRTYIYDMPLVTPSNDFYDVIHTSPASHSRTLLNRVIERVAEFHALTETTVTDDHAITAYLAVKATKNAGVILDFAKSAVPQQTFVLNGETRSFASWARLLDPAWLAAQVKDRRTACIHGDLTIENIIIAPDYPLGFYIIDPNSENIFDSPLIDWAKLMQSLHLGYETLNQGLTCTVDDGVMQLSHLRSQAYADLHMTLESEARNRLGADAVREIYFHEIINYLRLTTYKIRQSPMRGLGFFACTTILVDRYAERWG